MNTKNQDPSSEQKDLTKMSTQQLRHLLSVLEQRHDSLVTKNEQLANQAHDLRKVIKCVDKQNKEEIQAMLKKKKSLEEDIKDISKQLKTVNSSDNYKKMMAFKELMDE